MAKVAFRIARHSKVAFRIARHLLLPKEGESKNVVFSPLSMHVLLSLITAGSNGPTRDQLLSFLQFKTADDLNSNASQLFTLVSADRSSTGGPRLSFANGVWVDKSLSLKPSFSQVVETTYKATLASVDFQNKEDVAKEINSWAERKTNGLIEQIFTPHSLNFTNLILANAIYFKGSWIDEWTFDASQTCDGDFHLLNGGSVKVPFMTGIHESHIAKAFDGFKVLCLPYNNGKVDEKRNSGGDEDVHSCYSLYIFLPDETDGLPALVNKVCSESESLKSILPRSTASIRDFRIPRFKVSCGVKACHVLKEMGLVLPFSDGGLTGMVDSPVHVSEIVQKSVIEVNERGTEAAAISASRLGSAGRVIKPIDFVADHPFLFLIREDNTGTILFIGQVLNPLDS